MRIEIGAARSCVGASTARLCLGDALSPICRATANAGVVDLAHDRGEVAIADARLTTARICAEATLSFVEIVERIAAERTDKRLGRAGHRVLGVHGFEEQPHRAILGTGLLALLLDDRA